MAQLHSKLSTSNAVRHLNQQKLMGNTLELSYVGSNYFFIPTCILHYHCYLRHRLSRHPYIADPPSGYIAELCDNSLAVKEYANSRNNR